MKIIFVRHAHHKNDKLTSLGKSQAKNVCYDLEYEDIEAIYCSPAGRTFQTAEIIAKHLKINKINFDDALKDREDLNNPVTEKEIECAENYLNASYSCKIPEGCKDFLNRSFDFLNKIIKTHGNSDKSVLIVGHSSFSYALNTFFCGIPKDKQLIWTRIGNCSKICYEIKK